MIYLTKFIPYASSGSHTLYVPMHGVFPENLDIKDFLEGGIPYVYMGRDFVEAYAGIFRPERIFYSIKPSSSHGSELNIIISDEIFYILELLGDSVAIDREALISFLEFGKVLGGNTLIRNIKLLNAGLILRVNEEGVRLKLGFHHEFPQVKNKSLEELEEEFMNIAFKVFKEYLDVIKRKNTLVVVPLSAGVDSRFVLSMIHTLGYKNVITLTYGLRDKEYPVARKVAKTLGYENIFVEYTWDLWKKHLRDMLNYMVWASQLYLAPNVQEFISTREFINKICEDYVSKCENVVLVTGDISDVVAGKIPPSSRLLRVLNIEEFADFILENHSLFELCKECENSLVAKKFLLNSIMEYMGHAGMKKREISFIEIYEMFHWKEGPFKYISSSRLAYIYHGFGFIAPLWDGRIIRFLSSIPWKLKYKNNFYRNTLRKRLFAPLGIAFEDPTKGVHPIVKLARIMKSFIPGPFAGFTREILRSIQRLKDYRARNPCGFDEYFPRVFMWTLIELQNFPICNCGILKVINEYLKRAPRNVIAFNALTTILLISNKLC